MIIDENFKLALEKAVRFYGGQVRAAKKCGLSRSTLHTLLHKQCGTSITDATKMKILPFIKEFFPKNYPLGKWLAEKEGQLFSENDLKEGAADKRGSELKKNEETLLTLYRLVDNEKKVEIMKFVRKLSLKYITEMEISGSQEDGSLLY